MIKSYLLLALSAACLISANLNAQHSGHDDHDHHNHDDHLEHEHADQEAHIHGYAELTLALEGNSLEINLNSPATNIVGFEHKASTDEQITAVKEATSILESPTQLFTFTGTQCSLQQANADLSELIEHNNKHHHKHDHHERDKNKHKEEHKGEELHSEVTANYQYICEQGKMLKSISVGLLKNFPGIEKLKVMWLTDNQQGSTELTSKTSLIRLR